MKISDPEDLRRKLGALNKLDKRRDKFEFIGDHGMAAAIMGIVFLFVDKEIAVMLSSASIALSLIATVGLLLNIRALKRL